MSPHEEFGRNRSQRSAGIVRFAIDYPYFIIVACLMIVLLGSLALQLLPKDLLPAGNQAAVQILSFYPGMPVDNVEKDLTTRFERYTAQAIGMSRQESRSLSGVTVIRNFFNPDISLATLLPRRLHWSCLFFEKCSRYPTPFDPSF